MEYLTLAGTDIRVGLASARKIRAATISAPEGIRPRCRLSIDFADPAAEIRILYDSLAEADAARDRLKADMEAMAASLPEGDG